MGNFMTGLEACANASTPCALSSALLMDGCRGFGLKGGMNSPLNSPVKFFAVTVIAVARCPVLLRLALHGPRGRDNMKRGYRTGWRTWKGPELGLSAGRPPRACSKILGIRASFQRDNLRRHFGVRVPSRVPDSPVSVSYVRVSQESKVRVRVFRLRTRKSCATLLL